MFEQIYRAMRTLNRLITESFYILDGILPQDAFSLLRLTNTQADKRKFTLFKKGMSTQIRVPAK